MKRNEILRKRVAAPNSPPYHKAIFVEGRDKEDMSDKLRFKAKRNQYRIGRSLFLQLPHEAYYPIISIGIKLDWLVSVRTLTRAAIFWAMSAKATPAGGNGSRVITGLPLSPPMRT